MANFYDKVAKKYGGYAYGTNNPKYLSKYPNGNPEKIFKEKLLELSTNKIALDVGCGDSKFAFEIAEYFNKIFGVDTSKELLKIAAKKQKFLKVKNVFLSLESAEKTNFKDDSFDIIFCRRGPNYYDEYLRLLKPGGYYLEIGIGEKDAMDLKKIFGRGQNYGGWNNPQLLESKNLLKKAGFKIIFAKDFEYVEYYSTLRDLGIFLSGVPIFKDYGLPNDKKYLETYCHKFKSEKGIALKRHRVVLVARKNRLTLLETDRVYFWQVFFNFFSKFFRKVGRISTVAAAFGFGAKPVFPILDNF